MKDLIGFLDSGVGGISVLKTAAELLPNENLLYFGDNANAPYGTRPIEEIRALSRNAVDRLMRSDIKALVIACNTITAAYAAELRAASKIPVIGMEPAVKPASIARSNGIVLALATKATLSLDKFARLMADYGEGVIPVEGKGLVEIVESGQQDSEAARDALGTIFAPFLGKKVDGVVLGCTHYPFLRRQIEAFFPNAHIFDGREGTVLQLRRRLEEANLLTKQTCPGEIRMETSGNAKTLHLMHTLFETEI